MEKPIPYYDAEGRPRGFRTVEAARRLIANEVVTACYGRKGHLKAIYLVDSRLDHQIMRDRKSVV